MMLKKYIYYNWALCPTKEEMRETSRSQIQNNPFPSRCSKWTVSTSDTLPVEVTR